MLISKPQRTLSLATVLLRTAIAVGTALAAKKVFAQQRSETKRSFDGKVVLITGGSRGLGLALAEELGGQGARLAICARDSHELNRACQILSDRGLEAVPFRCDLTDDSQVRGLIGRVVERFSRLDILINNAGWIKVGPLESFHERDFEYAMELMFWATVRLTFSALPFIKASRGSIVNITSIGGRVSVPHLLPYSCAKFAAVGFSTGLSAELTSQGVNVLTVVPGLMRTGSYLNAEFTGEAKKEFAWFGIAGNNPALSVAADRAAREVRFAIGKRKHTCTISLPAKLLFASEALAPEFTRTVMDWTTRIMLPPSTESSGSQTGKQLNEDFGGVFQTFTALGKSAALTFNE